MSNVILVIVDSDEQWEDFYAPLVERIRTSNYIITAVWEYVKCFRRDFLTTDLMNVNRLCWVSLGLPTDEEMKYLSTHECFGNAYFVEDDEPTKETPIDYLAAFNSLPQRSMDCDQYVDYDDVLPLITSMNDELKKLRYRIESLEKSKD